MNECVFCKIIKKQIPKDFKFESENLVVFDDINPAAREHILIVPKKHISSIMDEVETGLLAEIFKVAKDLAQKNNLPNDQFRITVNGGKAQHVPHLHFHLLGGEFKRQV